MSRAENATAAVARTPRRFWNVPNSLTVSRLVLAVAVYGLIEFQAYAWALMVFLVAAATDALDGYFARLLKQESPLGRQLDPLIDKVIVAGCYIYLTTIPDTGVRPWMVTAIVVRELLIQGLRSLLEGQGQPFGAGPPASSRRSSSARRSPRSCWSCGCNPPRRRSSPGSATASPGWPWR